MSELRQNFLNKEWVIIATERAKRPEEMATHRPVRVILAFVETCVFCPSNESKTPREAMRFPADVAQSWAVRLVPNKLRSAFSRCGAGTVLESFAPPYRGVRFSRGHHRHTQSFAHHGPVN
jgi:hypothetical protein